MKVLYFDCFAGISGDMTIASLLSHVDVEEFKKKVKKIALDNFDIEIGETQKNSISARTFKVLYEEEHHHHHRHMKDVREIIEKSDLEEEVKKMSIEMFEKLAEAEAKVHGKSPEEVHFHEVGAVDSIVDIIGTAILIDMIKPDKIVSSPLPVSSGFIKTQHGLMPVPAPATAELLKGIPVYKSDIEGEIVTPTGAAIVKTLVNEFGGIPDMTINSIGYGAGTKDLEIPNVLRTYVGEEEVKKKPESLMILETNIDDMNPEFYQYLFEKLFENGALDVFLIPIIMKKQRPGTLITVICEKENADKLKEIIFKETSTFGIRYYEVLRHKLDRDFSIVETPYGKVRVKKGYLNGKLIKAYPEYEDVKAIAEKTGNSISDIYRNVIRHIDLLFF
ncbi:hypothetical protein SAMN04244560_00593 [Thermoanaerobacter thermohydrosulfuricus]|uniref:Pyridinium-3,5-bisthiocarboxylic acid mononucleotide nickel insertion protein n=3 Tax=Thermoanaerobacter TaxID=1754 RepID=A0A1G7K761_THETY|nr:nickel pincer cofactor biosynthesis protein LarC [Thermoanaerobacter thermohydrosulfuricus]SDF32831.1 hypothetical protein SAMN04244560_00593 [Thermoanaerobacter thermohydrosulfuricus]